MKTADILSAICFVTSNQGKVDELQSVLPLISRVDIDLPEIQAIDSREVIAVKLTEARRRLPASAIIVEDTALHLGCLNGFPGALIKWLLHSVGCQGIYDLCMRMGGFEAQACTVLGYLAEDSDVPLYFDGTLNGTICSPKGERGFGWDPIFVPHGHHKTLAEMEEAELVAIKMRRIAAEKLAVHLRDGIGSTGCVRP